MFTTLFILSTKINDILHPDHSPYDFKHTFGYEFLQKSKKATRV
jgi:hypothetical protein